MRVPRVDFSGVDTEEGEHRADDVERAMRAVERALLLLYQRREQLKAAIRRHELG